MQKNLFDFATQNKNENFNKKEQDFCQTNANNVKTNKLGNDYKFSQTEELSDNYNRQSNTNSQSNNSNIKSQTLEEQARSAYEKYQNYSQEQLLDEFLKTSRQKLKDGSLTSEKLTNTVNSLSPFLNGSQKEFLKDLLNKLND